MGVGGKVNQCPKTGDKIQMNSNYSTFSYRKEISVLTFVIVCTKCSLLHLFIYFVVMNQVSENSTLFRFRQHGKIFYVNTHQRLLEVIPLTLPFNKGTQENAASMLRALRKGTEKQASIGFC